MKTTAILYTFKGEQFLKLSTNDTTRQFSLKFLEKLCGFKLVDNAPEMLAKWGYIRVTQGCSGSYRKD